MILKIGYNLLYGIEDAYLNDPFERRSKTWKNFEPENFDSFCMISNFDLWTDWC